MNKKEDKQIKIVIEDKTLRGIEYNQDFLGDSSKVYGEEGMLDENGEPVIDPITKTPVIAPFMETHGDRIFGALEDALTQAPDDDMPELTPEQFKQLESGVPLEDILDDSKEITMIENHAQIEFAKQEEALQKAIKQEEDDYRKNFETLTDKIAEQEEVVKKITDKFNSCEDKEEKIKLFYEVHEEMNKLIEISSNVGSAVQNCDTSDIVGSLSSYDNDYDEDATRKYIKDL